MLIRLSLFFLLMIPQAHSRQHSCDLVVARMVLFRTYDIALSENHTHERSPFSVEACSDPIVKQLAQSAQSKFENCVGEAEKTMEIVLGGIPNDPSYKAFMTHSQYLKPNCPGIEAHSEVFEELVKSIVYDKNYSKDQCVRLLKNLDRHYQNCPR